MYEGLRNLDVPRRTRSGTKRVLRTGLIGALAFILGICGFGAYVYQHVNSSLNKAKDKSIQITPTTPNQPTNWLIVGSDLRSVVKGKEARLRQFRKGGTARTDTIMLLHVAAHAKKGVLISLPRDLYVKIPGTPVNGCSQYNRINSAFSPGCFKGGGRNLLIKTVESITGLPINHYVEINFASFQNIVNAIGGVDIYFPKPVQDKKSGLDITRAGCDHLDGLMALSFVRARYIYADADLGRIQAQQRFIRAVLGKARSELHNPLKVQSVATAIADGLVIDKNVTLPLAFGIAQKLSDPSNLDFRIFPGHTLPNSPYVFPTPSEDRAFFAALAKDLPLPDYGRTSQSLASPSDTHVIIENGSGRDGWAATNKVKLIKLGYQVVDIGTTPARAQTLIWYDSQSLIKAQLLQKQYPYATLQRAPKWIPSDVEVLLGSDSLPVTGTPTATATPTHAAPRSKELGASCG